jgi:hypothetical protein
MKWERIRNIDNVMNKGSTVERLNDAIFIIGGFQNMLLTNPTFPYLQVSIFDLLSFSWQSARVNTLGSENRSYHASVVMNGDIFISGGT